MGLTNKLKQSLFQKPQSSQTDQNAPKQKPSGSPSETIKDSADNTNHNQTPSITKDFETTFEPQATFRQLLERSPFGVIVHNENKIIFINPAGAKLLGSLSVEEFVGKAITDFLHPNYQTTIKNRMQQIISTNKETGPIEEQLVRIDGSDIDIEMIGTPGTYQDKPAVQLIIQDISKRKKTTNELLKRNRELTILQSAGVSITSRLDLRYVLDTVTEEMTKLLLVESCAIYEWSEADSSITKIAEYGSTGWWDSTSTAQIFNLADRPLITWVLEEQIPQQMTLSRPGTDPIELANMQKNGIKTLMLLPMVSRRSVVGLVELKDTRLEQSFTYQEISLAKLLANQAANAIENAKLYTQAQQEITERQRAEAELEEERAMLAQRVKERTADLSRANAELARAARLKDEFLASMSHELRTPLNSILGAAEILQEQIFGPLNDKQIRYLQNAEESGRHLLSLINDILDLSKIEAGKFEIHIGLVAVQTVCEASLRMVKELAYKKGVTVSKNLDKNTTKIQADEIRLKQVLVNLLSNAVKFTPEGGEIGLDVTGDEANQVAYFTVWDTGIGIAPQDMERLFEPFVQLDSRLAREYAGTGLGLSLVSRMVELHGGGVSVESEVEKGSRFTIALPWNENETITPDKAGTKPAQRDTLQNIVSAKKDSQPLILLAEDNEDNINTVLDYLEHQEYQVIIARNGKEAIERANEQKPDIILMDVQMPEMDGLEATRHLRSNTVFDAVPIIALTALAMPGDKEKCLKAGANQYLSKPVSLKNLANIINSYLNQHSRTFS